MSFYLFFCPLALSNSTIIDLHDRQTHINIRISAQTLFWCLKLDSETSKTEQYSHGGHMDLCSSTTIESNVEIF